MHKLNNHCRCSKCLPECSIQSCKHNNQEAVALFKDINVQEICSGSITPER